MKKLIKVKAPGKLYIAGEYAVVETGCPAILVGLNKYVYVSIEDSKDLARSFQNNTKIRPSFGKDAANTW